MYYNEIVINKIIDDCNCDRLRVTLIFFQNVIVTVKINVLRIQEKK